MKKILAAILMFLTVIAVVSCKEVVLTPQPINPLYKSMASFDVMDRASRDSVLAADSLELDIMMKFLGKHFVWHHDSVPEIKPHESRKEWREEEERYREQAAIPTMEELLVEWSRSDMIRMFMPPVDSVFPTLEPVENKLGLILANAENIGLDFRKMRYTAVVWGARNAIVTSDSVMFIALNHFLGSDFPGYQVFYEYERKMKTPERLPYSLGEVLVKYNYPYDYTDNSTVLSRMMYEGAVVYIVLKIVPDATLASTLGYTTDELEWLDSHYKEMWETVIGKDMIYSTSRETAKKLIDPAPNTSIISGEYPGRAGRYLGYRLILNYMLNNAKTPVTHLLAPEFYNDPSELVLAQ